MIIDPIPKLDTGTCTYAVKSDKVDAAKISSMKVFQLSNDEDMRICHDGVFLVPQLPIH